MKRLVAAGLWYYAFWYLGSTIAGLLGVPDLIGPVWTSGRDPRGLDPRGAIWAHESSRDSARPATARAAAPNLTAA